MTAADRDPQDENAAVESPLAEELPGGSEGIRAVLTELRRAVREKKVDGICAAYQTLRELTDAQGPGRAMELVPKALGEKGAEIVISAFSFRRCFMCSNGTVECEQCGGTGEAAPGESCPHCDGLGLVLCNFCRGTGWADPETVPEELASAVHLRQLSHVRREVRELAKSIKGMRIEELPQLSAARRRALAGELMRVSARMSELASDEELAKNERTADLGSMVSRIDKILTTLREAH